MTASPVLLTRGFLCDRTRPRQPEHERHQAQQPEDDRPSPHVPELPHASLKIGCGTSPAVNPAAMLYVTIAIAIGAGATSVGS
jgi:hypothetical protein